uniref:BTB domain-containing protein n=1 Tax=Pinguiococcus pyrenoidosus TaxID=172671 RepID=A0A7R9YCF2_9STRA
MSHTSSGLALADTWTDFLRLSQTAPSLCRADICLHVSDEERLWLHSLVLCAWSREAHDRVLGAVTKNGVSKTTSVKPAAIGLAGISSRALLQLVAFLYSGDAELDAFIALELLEVAERWCIEALREFCRLYLRTDSAGLLQELRNLDIHHLLVALHLAEKHGVGFVFDAAARAVAKDWQRFVKDTSFLSQFPQYCIRVAVAELGKGAPENRERAQEDGVEEVDSLMRIPSVCLAVQWAAAKVSGAAGVVEKAWHGRKSSRRAQWEDLQQSSASASFTTVFDDVLMAADWSKARSSRLLTELEDAIPSAQRLHLGRFFQGEALKEVERDEEKVNKTLQSWRTQRSGLKRARAGVEPPRSRSPSRASQRHRTSGNDAAEQPSTANLPKWTEIWDLTGDELDAEPRDPQT